MTIAIERAVARLLRAGDVIGLGDGYRQVDRSSRTRHAIRLLGGPLPRRFAVIVEADDGTKARLVLATVADLR